MTTSGLTSSEVTDLGVIFFDYSPVGLPMFTAVTAFPQQNLVDFDPGGFQVIVSRTNPNLIFGTPETDLIESLIEFVAPPTP